MKNTMTLIAEDADLLKEIASAKRYPIVQFELRSSKDTSLRSIALPNVRIHAVNESMEVVKSRGAALKRLSDEGYIQLDFHPAILVASDYSVYSESALYAQLCDLAEQGKTKPGYLFDIPRIKKGRVVLTAKGRKATM